ncbi:MAG: DUF4330 family protein [Clostridia bacterium]|nr:DUF4330 family protein [Clostridia bacterium]MBR7083238.1 DUF4330 family protein [Clostridia bacterium]
MDKRSSPKEKKRLNIFDVLIIVVVIACVAAIGVRVYFTTHAQTDDESAVITYEVYGISEENAAEFAQGKKIYLQSNGAEIGMINTVVRSASRVEAIEDDGSITVVGDPYLITVTGRMTLYGKTSEGGFFIGGQTPISLGSSLSVYTDRNMFTLTVVEMTQNSSK